MILDRSRGPDALAPLPEELEQAVAGLRAFVEPTPEQLELSRQRVQQALGLAGLAAAAPPLPLAAGAPPLPLPPLAAASARAARLLRAQRALWALSGGVTAMALLAGFVIGRWTSAAPADPRQLDPAAVAALVPLAPGEPAVARAEQAGPAPVPGPLPREDAAERSATARSTTLPSPLADVRRAVKARSLANAGEPLCSARDPLLRAECLLRRQQPERALVALRGAASQTEREQERVLGLTLLARCQLGQQVLSLSKQFFARWPASPLKWRIRNECPSAEPPHVNGSLQRAEIDQVLGR